MALFMSFLPTSLLIALIASPNLLLQCFTLPVLSPPDNHSDNSWSLQHAIGPWMQSKDHHQAEASSSNPHPGSSSAGPHSSSFSEDLDAFIDKWYTHPDPEILLPLPPSRHESSSLLASGPSKSAEIVGNSQHARSQRYSSEANKASPSNFSQSLERSTPGGSNWRKGLQGKVMKIYDVYKQRTGASPGFAAKVLKKRGDREIVEALLSNDIARQEAAINVLGRPRIQQSEGPRQKHLGDQADEITKKLADYHRIHYHKARQLLNRRLGRTEALLLKDPDTFGVGASILQPKPQHGRRKNMSQEEVRDSKGKGKEIGEERDASKAKRPRQTINMVSLDQAQKILPAKLIGKMTSAYRSYNQCHRITSRQYVRKAVIEHPELASDLAADLLSEDKARVDTAIAKIGIPKSKEVALCSVDTGIALSDALAHQVEDVVMRLRKLSRSNARNVIKSRLTEEIATELKQPDKFMIAIQKLIPIRKYKSRRTSEKGKAPSASHLQLIP